MHISSRDGDRPCSGARKQPGTSNRETMAFHVLTGELAHETNTFNTNKTTISNFEREVLIEGRSEILRARTNTKSGLGGVIEASQEYGWDLSVNLCASANPTGTLTVACFELLVAKLLAPLEEEPRQVDGILLLLHGACVVDGFDDAEGELLERIRSRVGPRIPIVCTLDLHANVTPKMAALCNSLVALRTYPHVDQLETALRGAAILNEAMHGRIRPTQVIAKRPQLHGLDRGRTNYPGSPMQTLIDRAEAVELTEKGILSVSICAGFPAADVDFVGPSVTVTLDLGAENEIEIDTLVARAQAIAEEFMDYCWEMRDFSSVELVSPEVAVARAAELQRTGHVILAEMTDNPGSGHYGDATNLLRALLQGTIVHGLRSVAFYSIYDSQAVQHCKSIGIGGCGWVEVGGRHGIGGGTLKLFGQVVVLSDGRFEAHGGVCGGTWQNLGESACLRLSAQWDRPDAYSAGAGVRVTDVDTGAFTGFELCITSNKQQALDQAQLINLGIDPRRKEVLALKSMNHFRADFGDLAAPSHIIMVDGGGLGSVIAGGAQVDPAFQYFKCRRPIWPLDADVIF